MWTASTVRILELVLIEFGDFAFVGKISKDESHPWLDNEEVIE